MVSELILGELAQFAVYAIQAVKFMGSEEAVAAHVDEMAKQGATMRQISESLRDMNVAAETDAQQKIDDKRREQGGGS